MLPILRRNHPNQRAHSQLADRGPNHLTLVIQEMIPCQSPEFNLQRSTWWRSEAPRERKCRPCGHHTCGMIETVLARGGAFSLLPPWTRKLLVKPHVDEICRSCCSPSASSFHSVSDHIPHTKFESVNYLSSLVRCCFPASTSETHDRREAQEPGTT